MSASELAKKAQEVAEILENYPDEEIVRVIRIVLIALEIDDQYTLVLQKTTVTRGNDV